MSMEICRDLREAVREYYDCRMCQHIITVRFIRDQHGLEEKLLVRYMDDDGDERSALLTVTRGMNGEWELSDEASCLRDEEHVLLRDFRYGGFEEDEEDVDEPYDDVDDW